MLLPALILCRKSCLRWLILHLFVRYPRDPFAEHEILQIMSTRGLSGAALAQVGAAPRVAVRNIGVRGPAARVALTVTQRRQQIEQALSLLRCA